MLQEKSNPPPPPERLAPPYEGTEDGKLIAEMRAEIRLLKEEMKGEMTKQLAQQTRMILSEFVTLSGHGPVVSVDS